MNTSKSDHVKGTSNFPHGNVQHVSSFNTIINLQKLIDKESSFSINDKRTDQNHISEEILSHQN